MEDYLDRRPHVSAKMWALVTGASEGIGFAFARSLAKRGFNVILISRSESKLKAAVNELKKEFKHQDFKYLAKDFELGTETDFYKEIYDFTKDLDVCILVNNVGYLVSVTKHLIDFSYEEARRQILVCTCPQVALSNYFQRKFLQRKSEMNSNLGGAIINLSSISKITPCHQYQGYAATKKYNNMLSNAANYYFGKDIDILCVAPGYVSTKMTDFKENDAETCSPEEMSEGALRFLGRAEETNGPLRHSLFAIFYRLAVFFPAFITNIILPIALADPAAEPINVEKKQA